MADAKRTCTFPNCGQPHYSLGLCRRHRGQESRGVELTPLLPGRSAPVAEKLAAMSARQGECIVWKAARTTTGYGIVSYQGRTWKAHRLAYTLAFGVVDDSLVIDHKCHQLLCINTEHLQAVTKQQNQENRAGATRVSRSGVRGVHYDKQTGLWRASAGHGGRTYHAGRHATIDKAATAAAELRRQLHTNSLRDGNGR